MFLSYFTPGMALAYLLVMGIGLIRPKRRLGCYELGAIFAGFVVLGYVAQGKYLSAGLWLFNSAVSVSVLIATKIMAGK